MSTLSREERDALRHRVFGGTLLNDRECHAVLDALDAAEQRAEKAEEGWKTRADAHVVASKRAEEAERKLAEVKQLYVNARNALVGAQLRARQAEQVNERLRRAPEGV